MDGLEHRKIDVLQVERALGCNDHLWLGNSEPSVKSNN